MIWVVKQLISIDFCIQIIKGQQCPKSASHSEWYPKSQKIMLDNIGNYSSDYF